LKPNLLCSKTVTDDQCNIWSNVWNGIIEDSVRVRASQVFVPFWLPGARRAGYEATRTQRKGQVSGSALVPKVKAKIARK
jgi:hypothetical protein